MKKLSITLLLFLLVITAYSQQTAIVNPLRAPAYPLVTIDPYTCAWSFSDKLYDDNVRHWTGVKNSLIGAIRVDGTTYRFMGTEEVALVPVAPLAKGRNAWTGRYTFEQPEAGFEKAEFNDTQWKEGRAAFGTKGTSNMKTLWETKDIWVRREIMITEDPSTLNLYLEFSHDDGIEIYFNGVQIVNTGDDAKENVRIPLPEAAKKTVVKGRNVIAIHCHNSQGGAYVDFGLFNKIIKQQIFEKTAQQKSVSVMPTQTHYDFVCGPVNLKLNFTSPLLMDNLDVLSRPISYITYDVASLDKKAHDVQIYFEASPEWAVNTLSQEITSEKIEANGLTYLKTGTKEQNVLGRKGDNVRIDWGYFYLVGKQDKTTSYTINESSTTKKEFYEKGKLSGVVNKDLSPDMEKQMTALALSQEVGKVGAQTVSNKIMIGYDDLYSMQYFGDNLRPWWNNDGKKTIADEFVKANNEYAGLILKCNTLDTKIMVDAEKAGGKNYADLCALAYRQAIAAHKLLKDKEGNILFLSKENFSNGSVNTVDVTYPSAPMFLLYNPDLLKGMLNGIFYFSESGKWKNPFAAHDIGTYPLANGQTYGEGMPVEESGNMLLLATAISKVEGNAKYAEKHWATLTTWADYLLEKGLDPENQLCTDDFAGHLAHNANLSIKAILGIAGYGQMAKMLGKNDIATKYTAAAREMAQKWIAMDADGDHYSLTFDKKGTWSQKYNLVWDKVLNMGIFPKEVAQKEIAYYLTKQNVYGLPLDSRATYTKGDWIIWTATMAQDKATFQKFIDPLYKYANETTSRVPLSDWHQTITGKQQGFQARSVVGGFYFKLLDEKLKKK
jgi:hypothetical protein